MKVRELIELLEQVPGDSRVIVEDATWEEDVLGIVFNERWNEVTLSPFANGFEFCDDLES